MVAPSMRVKRSHAFHAASRDQAGNTRGTQLRCRTRSPSGRGPGWIRQQILHARVGSAGQIYKFTCRSIAACPAATAANKAVIEQMKVSALRKSASEKDGAVALGAQLDALVLTFERKAGESNHLFGSVTSQDIAHELDTQGFKIDRRKIHLEEPLKTVGEFHVPIRIHREVTAHVQVNVKSDAPERDMNAPEVEDDTVFKSTYTGELDDNRD